MGNIFAYFKNIIIIFKNKKGTDRNQFILKPSSD